VFQPTLRPVLAVAAAIKSTGGNSFGLGKSAGQPSVHVIILNRNHAAFFLLCSWVHRTVIVFLAAILAYLTIRALFSGAA
jgi:hypothetical protein